MTVEVELFATLAAYLPPGAATGRAVLDVADGSTVQDVALALGIPETVPRIVLVNGHDAEEDRRLRSGDVLSLFPPLAGGGEWERVRREGRGETSRPGGTLGGLGRTEPLPGSV